MEQVTNSMTLDLIQTAAVQNQPPKANGKTDGDSDFRKLMDKAAGGKDAKTEEAPEAAKAETATVSKPEKAPVETRENSLERIKRLLEQGAFAVTQPINPTITWSDGQVYQPGEYVEVWTEAGIEVISITDLDEAQLQELQQLMSNVQAYGTIDVSDPEADAMLEATDPTVDHSPAALLEKVVAEQFGRVVSDSTAEAVRPEAEVKETVETVEVVEITETAERSVEPLMEETETETEATDAQQAPQPLFHDVKAAPVKVGEVYRAPGTEKPDVVRQVDNGVAQALEKGESVVRIQLEPENLGSVTVEITRTAEGIIRVALNAHSGETRNLLERHAGELQGLLGSRTQQSVEVNVQRQQESQQNQNHNYDGHNGHAQDGEHRQRRQQQEQSGGVDFIQQLRLGLIPADGDE